MCYDSGGIGRAVLARCCSHFIYRSTDCRTCVAGCRRPRRVAPQRQTRCYGKCEPSTLSIRVQETTHYSRTTPLRICGGGIPTSCRIPLVLEHRRVSLWVRRVPQALILRSFFRLPGVGNSLPRQGRIRLRRPRHPKSPYRRRRARPGDRQSSKPHCWCRPCKVSMDLVSPEEQNGRLQPKYPSRHPHSWTGVLGRSAPPFTSGYHLNRIFP